MTLKEFFRKARRGRTWRITPMMEFVRCEASYCPLGAVQNSMLGYENKMPPITAAAGALGLRPATAAKIAFAADDPKDRNRPWLLKNLGVSHTPTPEPPQ